MEIIRRHFSSIDALVSHGSSVDRWGQSSRREDDSGNWHGTKNWEQACEFVRNGWPQGRKLLAPLRDRLVAQSVPAQGAMLTMDVAGAYPIAALAAAGDPACMVDNVPTEDRVRPIVRLAVSCGTSWLYSAKAIQNYGAAIACLIDALEASNFRVEIMSVWPVQSRINTKKFFVSSTTLKEAHDIVDIDRLAFALINASWLRRFNFAALEREHKLRNDFDVTYGLAIEPNATGDGWLDDDQIFLIGAKQFSADGPELATPENALAAIKPLLEERLADRNYKLPEAWLDLQTKR